MKTYRVKYAKGGFLRGHMILRDGRTYKEEFQKMWQERDEVGTSHNTMLNIDQNHGIAVSKAVERLVIEGGDSDELLRLLEVSGRGAMFRVYNELLPEHRDAVKLVLTRAREAGKVGILEDFQARVSLDFYKQKKCEDELAKVREMTQDFEEFSAVM